MSSITLLLALQSATPSPTETPVASPPGNLSIYLGIAALVVAMITVWLTWLSVKYSQQKTAAEQKVERMRQYARDAHKIDYVYQDIVLLGPRNAGKTRVAELWRTPWFDSSKLQPTTHWQLYESSIADIGSETKRDDLFEVDRVHDLVLRVKLHDYPGERHYQIDALKKLPSLKNAALLLLFDLDANEDGEIKRKPIDDNHAYYSKYFAETLENTENITQNLSEVIVVFNKIDLLPRSWDEATTLRKLSEVNVDAIRRIEGIFGVKVRFFLVSAQDNRGLISLLGEACASGLSKQTKARLDRRLEEAYTRTANPPDLAHKKKSSW